MKISTAAVDALATYRITKLVIDDEITREIREKAFKYLDAHPGKVTEKVTYFLNCPWCVSIWAGGGIVLLRLVNPQAADAIGTILASSATTGLLYSRF